MTPKEKAKELYLKFSRYTDSEFTEFHHKYTKECTLIAVDEIYQANINIHIAKRNIYWDEVKKEIELL